MDEVLRLHNVFLYGMIIRNVLPAIHCTRPNLMATTPPSISKQFSLNFQDIVITVWPSFYWVMNGPFLPFPTWKSGQILWPQLLQFSTDLQYTVVTLWCRSYFIFIWVTTGFFLSVILPFISNLVTATLHSVFNRFSSNFQDIVVITWRRLYYTGVMIWSFLSELTSFVTLAQFCGFSILSSDFLQTFRLFKRPSDIDHILFMFSLGPYCKSYDLFWICSNLVVTTPVLVFNQFFINLSRYCYPYLTLIIFCLGHYWVLTKVTGLFSSGQILWSHIVLFPNCSLVSFSKSNILIADMSICKGWVRGWGALAFGLLFINMPVSAISFYTKVVIKINWGRQKCCMSKEQIQHAATWWEND